MYKLAEEDPNLTLQAIPPMVPAAAQPSVGADHLFEKNTADLASSCAAAMVSVLEHESAALVAQVLAARQWPWREEMLALCSPERRAAIAAAPREHAPALLDYVLRKLAAGLT